MIKVGRLFVVISILGLFVTADPMIRVLSGIAVISILFGIPVYRVETVIKKSK
jgi:hypothetical protein